MIHATTAAVPLQLARCQLQVEAVKSAFAEERGYESTQYADDRAECSERIAARSALDRDLKAAHDLPLGERMCVPRSRSLVESLRRDGYEAWYVVNDDCSHALVAVLIDPSTGEYAKGSGTDLSAVGVCRRTR